MTTPTREHDEGSPFLKPDHDGRSRARAPGVDMRADAPSSSLVRDPGPASDNALFGLSARRHWGLELALASLIFIPVTVSFGLPIHEVTAGYLAMIAIGVVCLVQFPGGISATAVLIALAPTAFIALSALHASARIPTIASAIRPWAALAILALGLRAFAAAQPDAFRRALASILPLGAAIGALAVYQRAVGGWPVLDELARAPQYTSLSYPGRSGGTMGHPIILGAVMAAVLILTVAMRPRQRLLYISLATMAVLLSGSRSALVALMVVTLVAGLSRTRERISATTAVVTGWTVLLVGTVAYAFGAAAVKQSLGDLLERFALQGDASAAQRGDRFSVAWNLITESPGTVFAGHGPGYSVTYLSTVDVGFTNAYTFDNTYLSVWVDFGLLALVPLIASLLIAFTLASLPGRCLLALVATEAMFFDITSWPAILLVAALGAAMFRGVDIRLRRTHAQRKTPSNRDGDPLIAGCPTARSASGSTATGLDRISDT